ncbi:hypothetical protein BBJ28_00007647 [Nothophytophthora sp. Chile5]|nr:hypothetical protein BBJ28_00007647 [Nothophytophthora sp. Chile5]
MNRWLNHYVNVVVWDATGSGAGRGLITGIGAGSGAGSSWTTCQLAFAGDANAQAALDKTDKALVDLKEKLSN